MLLSSIVTPHEIEIPCELVGAKKAIVDKNEVKHRFTLGSQVVTARRGLKGEGV